MILLAGAAPGSLMTGRDLDAVAARRKRADDQQGPLKPVSVPVTGCRGGANWSSPASASASSGPQTYSRTIDFMVAHVAIVSCSSGDSVRGLPSIMGSTRCLTWPSRWPIQPPLQPSALLPHTTGASIAAMTSVGQVLLV